MLNPKTAKNAAKQYVEKKLRTFNINYVYVGQTEKTPIEIYVNTFLNGLYGNFEQVEKIFFNRPTFEKEYLIKVSTNSDKELISEIIRKPNNLNNDLVNINQKQDE